MGQGTLTSGATASLTARGTTRSSGTLSWTPPSYPEGVTAWDSVRVSGSWEWTGKGNVSRVTINGTNTSGGIAFDVDITGKTSPLTITCVGNKNATGNSFTWSDLTVTFAYTQQGTSHTLTVRYGSTTIIADEVESSVSVVYNGSVITTVASGQTKTLRCAGMLMAGNVTINGKTLNCGGKIASGDVAIEVGE